MNGPELLAIQKQIDAHHLAQNEKINKMLVERDTGKSEIFAERSKLLKEKGVSPATFWRTVFRQHAQIVEELFGPYDDRILNSMTDFSVKYADTETTVELTFEANEFFTETKLWAKFNKDQSNTEASKMTFSGVTWKEGKGPIDESDDDDEQNQPFMPPKQQGNVGQKRGREEINDCQGPSFFQCFEALPEEPKRDEFDSDSEGDEDFDDADEEYDGLLNERDEIFNALIGEIWEDPAGVVAGVYSQKEDEEGNCMEMGA